MTPAAFFPHVIFLGIGLQCVQMRLYTNRWAVKITGGPNAADLIADKYGFVNMGQVSPLQNDLPLKCVSKSNVYKVDHQNKVLLLNVSCWMLLHLL